MPALRVLDVGQCSMDHASISRFLQKAIGAEVDGAASHTQALQTLRADPGRYNLVLVNRVLDRTGESGLDLIRSIRADQALAEIPMMLVSNYPDAQQQAVEIGAQPGFGKASLGDETSIRLLREALTCSSEH